MTPNNPDCTSSNVLLTINNFNKFLKITENIHWARKSTSESIKNAFKLASYIERVIENFNSKSISEEFLQALKDWLLQNEQRTMTYEVIFFQYASDHVLDMFLFNRAVPIASADVALRIYTSFHSMERLQKFLKDRILKYTSYDTILNVITEAPTDVKEIEAWLMLKDWEKIINEGGIEHVKACVNEMFSDYKLSKSLHVLLKIVCIETENEVGVIKCVIIEKLQEKLSNHSLLNKVFWNYIFKELDPTILACALASNKTLIDLLFSFIEYAGSMMSAVWVNSEKTWISNNEYSLFPEITYDDLFKIIKQLHQLNGDMRDVVVLKVTDALKNTSSDIWEDMLFSL